MKFVTNCSNEITIGSDETNECSCKDNKDSQFLGKEYLGNNVKINNEQIQKSNNSTQIEDYSIEGAKDKDKDKDKEKEVSTSEKGFSNIYTIVYFFTSIGMIFILIIFSLIKEYFFTNKPKVQVLKHVPEFYTLKTIQPQFFAVSILIISISGLFNVWYFCSMMLQRFSVPELSKNKIIIHFMFIFGSFSHFIFIFFGFSPAIIGIQTMKLKSIELTLTMLIYLVFIFFNLAFALLAWYAIETLRSQNKQAYNNLLMSCRIKMYMIAFSVVILASYISSIVSYNNYMLTHVSNEELNNQYHAILKLAIFLLPYILYITNAFLNLTYYSDILKIQEHLNNFMDRDYLVSGEGEETQILI